MKNFIVDYGSGNLGSIVNALNRLGFTYKITAEKSEIQSADRLILPGVGNSEFVINRVKELQLLDTLRIKINKDEIPTLGICLGMQIMCEFTEEGNVKNIGIIKDNVTKLPDSPFNPIPNIGWRNFKTVTKHMLTEELKIEESTYYSHSYALLGPLDAEVLATTFYNAEFASIIKKKNFIGVQFHPEKSLTNGDILLRNFNKI